MGGSSTKTTDTTEKKDPWAAAVPALNTALTGAQNAYDNTYNGPQVASLDPNVSAGQNTILANAGTGMISNLGKQAGANIGTVLNNGGYADGMQGAMSGIGSSLGQFNNTLNSAQGYLDPYANGSRVGSNPYLDQVINASMQNTADAVNRQFSASGRYGSGAQTNALGTSLGNVEATARLGQYNTDQGNQLAAIQGLGNLANTGLQGNVAGQGAMANIGQQAFNNTQTGLNSLGAVNTAQNLDAASQMGIGGQRMDYAQSLIDSANQAPWQKVNNLASVAGGIGSLGGSGTSHSVAETETDPGAAGVVGGILGGLGGLSNFSKGLGAAGGWSGMFSSMLPFLTGSDERIKENIEPVGKLNDGSNVYSYNYKGEERPQIGLLAQEVEKRTPDAVVELNGVKHVQLGMATAKSAEMGKKKPGQRL